MDNESKFAEIICEALNIKTPSQIREEELIKVLADHIDDYLNESVQLYKKIFEPRYKDPNDCYIDDLRLAMSIYE